MYANVEDRPFVIPAEAWTSDIGSAIAIGAIAGPMPAPRATRLSPTEAPRTA